MIKRIISFILCLLLMLSLAIPSQAEEEVTRGYYCVSNISDRTTFILVSKNNKTYISANDASAFSGYRIENQDSNRVLFSHSSFGQCEIPTAFSTGKTYWIPFEESLEKLNTQITAPYGVFFFEAKKHTRDEFLDYTESLIFDSGMFELPDFSNMGINKAAIIACNTVFSGSLISKITGRYKREQYNNIFNKILDGKDIKTPIYTNFIKLDGVLEQLATIDAETPDNPITDFDQIVTIGELYKGTHTLKDLAKAVTKGATQTIGISGFDLKSQVAIYNYINSIASASQEAMEMIVGTYFEEGSDDPTYLPRDARQTVMDINDYFSGDKYIDLLDEYLKEEAKTIIVKTGEDGIKYLSKEAIKALFDAEEFGVAYSLVKSTMALAFKDELEQMSDIETVLCIEELQKSLEAGYMAYSGYGGITSPSDSDYIHLKNLTMLYIRLAQIGWDILEKHVDSNPGKVYGKFIENIMDFSDYDILGSAKNDKQNLSNMFWYEIKGELFKITAKWNGKDLDGNLIEVIPNLEITTKQSIRKVEGTDGRTEYFDDSDNKLLAVVTRTADSETGEIEILLYSDRVTYSVGLDADIEKNDMLLQALSWAGVKFNIEHEGKIVKSDEPTIYRAYTGYHFGGICNVENGELKDFMNSDLEYQIDFEKSQENIDNASGLPLCRRTIADLDSLPWNEPYKEREGSKGKITIRGEIGNVSVELEYPSRNSYPQIIGLDSNKDADTKIWIFDNIYTGMSESEAVNNSSLTKKGKDTYTVNASGHIGEIHFENGKLDAALTYIINK